MKKICVLFSIITIATASMNTETDNLLSSALRFVRDCGDKSMLLCAKERALNYVDNINGDVKIGEGIQLVQTEPIPDGGRSLSEMNLSENVETREGQVDSMLADRIARFLGTHTLQFKVPKESIEDMQRSLEEARGKGKKTKKLLLPLLLLFKLKAAALLPLVLGFLALIAFKALIIGKLALLLSGIIGLKKLFESKHSAQNYEVVASHPHGGFDEHSHYSRSMDDAHNLAYGAHQQ